MLNYLKGSLSGFLSRGLSYISNLNIKYLDPEAPTELIFCPVHSTSVLRLMTSNIILFQIPFQEGIITILHRISFTLRLICEYKLQLNKSVSFFKMPLTIVFHYCKYFTVTLKKVLEKIFKVLAFNEFILTALRNYIRGTCILCVCACVCNILSVQISYLT